MAYLLNETPFSQRFPSCRSSIRRGQIISLLWDRSYDYTVGRGIPQACRIQVYRYNGLTIAISSELPGGPSCDLPAPAWHFLEDVAAEAGVSASALVWLSHHPMTLTNINGDVLSGPDDDFIVTRPGNSEMVQDQSIGQAETQALIGGRWTLEDNNGL